MLAGANQNHLIRDYAYHTDMPVQSKLYDSVVLSAMALSGGHHPSAEAVSYMIHHVVLPPELPQEDDRNPGHERNLLEQAVLALQDLQSITKGEYANTVTSAIATIKNLRDCRNDRGDASEAQIERFLTKLTMGETDEALPLEIKVQNAGTLISRCANSVNFEFFELLPANEAAMNPGRLIRIFPGYAAEIPISKMTPELQKSLARTISKMTTQTAPDFQPEVRKNGKMLAENRDTTHPGLVTDFLMTFITALGKSTNVQRISKNTREEVLWNDCFQPWKRSPLWLLLRVALQLHFTRATDSLQPPDQLYKAFMIIFLSRLSDLVSKFSCPHLQGRSRFYTLNSKEQLWSADSRCQNDFSSLFFFYCIVITDETNL